MTSEYDVVHNHLDVVDAQLRDNSQLGSIHCIQAYLSVLS